MDAKDIWLRHRPHIDGIVICLYDDDTLCPKDPERCCLISPNWEALHGDYDAGQDPF